jgi:glycerol-3-phosphate acyltransferase PlsX
VHPELERLDLSGLDVEIVHAADVVGMEDKPAEVLRRKKDSSIHTACRLVRDGAADAVVSAGNSGATVACGMFILGRIRGISRPALAGVMPTAKGPMVLIDVGANVDTKARHLLQFALMADVFAEDILGIANPTVGLLSIGEEEGKGNTTVKEAFDLLKSSELNFVGNVEGRDIFTGDVDVVVCDGFVGNVALKLSEGLAQAMGTILRRELLRTPGGRLGAWLARKAFIRFRNVTDYAEYGGAPLLGLTGLVEVCHGASNEKAIMNAVKMAGRFVTVGASGNLSAKLAAHGQIPSGDDKAAAGS